MAENPNIAIVVIDSFRPDHLSMFGYKKETDANLKRIAKGSAVFTRQFSVANGTAPAVTTILSGLLPTTHRVYHQFPYTKPEEYEAAEKIAFWLPSFLKEKGYETMCFDWLGEWFARGFDTYKESEKETDLLFVPTKETMDMAISTIKSSRKPFFAFMHLWDTHFPFPNTPYVGSGKDESAKILASIKDEKQRTYVRGRMDKAKLYTVQDVVNKYDETLRIIDREVGRLYDFLKKERLLDNTIFAVLGDHGDVINEHGIYFANCGMFDEAIRAPMMMKLPGIDGKITNEMVQNVDIVPTILDFMGERKKVDGKSLIPLIKTGKKVRSEVTLVDAFASDVKCIRTETKKLIFAKDGFCNMCKSSHHHGYEEYDLSKDPNESKNVFSGESELSRFLK